MIIHLSLLFNLLLQLSGSKLPRDDDQLTAENSGYDSGEIKDYLVKKYRFWNDQTSTRYRVTSHKNTFPGARAGETSESNEREIEWVFRSYAARRIVGGMETSITTYPYNVAIAKEGRHWCGGAVIDEQWVLTAGHCMEVVHDDPEALRDFVIRGGSSFHNRGGYRARVNKAFFHPMYTVGNADYDYSLVRLDRPLPIGRTIAVLNLPSKDYRIREQDILIVTGWGSTDSSGAGHIPDRLRFVPVPVMVRSQCQKSYKFYITPRMLCAGYATGGKDACNHDSGGPAVRDGVLLGLVSFGGRQCGDPNSPGVYSLVSEITGWVEQTISRNEASKDPKLQKKIQKARMRERELKRFRAKLKEDKHRIKMWLRATLNSPAFLSLAKKKFREAGIGVNVTARGTQDQPETNGTQDLTSSERLIDGLIEQVKTGRGSELAKTLFIERRYNNASVER